MSLYRVWRERDPEDGAMEVYAESPRRAAEAWAAMADESIGESMIADGEEVRVHVLAEDGHKSTFDVEVEIEVTYSAFPVKP